MGGTWDLFRYPGVRSDSDMYTLGYSFRPWAGAKAIADGDSIREYIQATVADEGLAARIRLNHRVVAAQWSSEAALWTVTAVVRPTASTAGRCGVPRRPVGHLYLFLPVRVLRLLPLRRRVHPGH